MNKKILCYLSHPSSGKAENTLDTENIIRELYNNDDIFERLCIVSPIHNYGFMYDDVEYYKGLSFCTDLLKHCDIMLVFGDWENSTGCKKEVELCKEEDIPYMIMGNSSELNTKIHDGILEEILGKVSKRN